MNDGTKRRWAYLLFAAVPLAYAAMFLPVWGSAALRFSGVPLVLFAVQCACFALAAVRLVLSFAGGERGAWTRKWFFCVAAAVSVLILCVTAPFFILESAGIPWFPAQR
jgi:hypothetical protein